MFKMIRIWVLLIFGFAACNQAGKSDQEYDLSEIYEGIMDLNHTIDQSEIDEDPDLFQIIDAREKADFASSPIIGAINVPEKDFLKTKWEEVLSNEEITYVLHHTSYEEAHGSWLLLKSLNDSEVYVLTDESELETSFDGSKYDYATILNSVKAEYEKAIEDEKKLATQTKPAPPKVKKKKTEDEEEEGC